jgi:hypothetical protein
MKMSTEVLTKTEAVINRAFEQHDITGMVKETLFVMNNTVCAFSQ